MALRQEQLQAKHHQQRDHARHQHAQRKIHETDVPSRPDIGSLHVAVVDAKHQNQRHFRDEKEAEEEGEAPQRLLPSLLEGDVVDLVDGRAEQIEHRQHDDGGEDRVGAGRGIDDVSDVGTQNDEGRVRDIDDVQHAEGDRDADGHGRVETTKQQTRDYGVDQKIQRNAHAHPRPIGAFLSSMVPLPIDGCGFCSALSHWRGAFSSKADRLAILHVMSAQTFGERRCSPVFAESAPDTRGGAFSGWPR
jgi:hypothetical protein